MALSNVDEIIELIKASPAPAEAKQRLLGRPWKSSLVQEMLARSDIARSRPDGLTPDLGLHPDGYRLSEAQAQAHPGDAAAAAHRAGAGQDPYRV